MTMWTGIVLIVLISLGFSYLRSRAGQAGEQQQADLVALREELLALKERIATLEAIVIEDEKERPFRSL